MIIIITEECSNACVLFNKHLYATNNVLIAKFEFDC